MKMVGRVEIPEDAFLSVLKIDDEDWTKTSKFLYYLFKIERKLRDIFKMFIKMTKNQDLNLDFCCFKWEKQFWFLYFSI